MPECVLIAGSGPNLECEVRIAVNVDFVVEHERSQTSCLRTTIPMLKDFLRGIKEQLQRREPLLPIDHPPCFDFRRSRQFLLSNHGPEEVNARTSLCGTALAAALIERFEVPLRSVADIVPEGIPLIFLCPDIGSLERRYDVTDVFREQSLQRQYLGIH